MAIREQRVCDVYGITDPSDVRPVRVSVEVNSPGGDRDVAECIDMTWIRSIVRKCRDAGVPCFVKQLGALPSIPVGADAVRWIKEYPNIKLVSTGTGTYFATTKHPKGGDPAEWPADLRVREWPEVKQ